MAKAGLISSLFGSKDDEAESSDVDFVSAQHLGETEMDEAVEAIIATEQSGVAAQPMSEDALQKRREIQKIRSDVKYFHEQLTQSELFASKARDNLKMIAEFVQDSELELNALEELTAENRTNENKVQKLTEELEEARHRLIEKDVELVAETNRLSEVRDALEESRATNTELTEMLNNAKSEIHGLQRARSELENEFNAKSIRLSNVESEKRVFGETIERQNRELSDYLDSTSELEKTVSELEKRQSKLFTQRDRLSAELIEKSESVKSLKEEVLELRSGIDSLRKELESKERHSASKLRSREDEIFALKSEIDTLHSQLSVRKQMFNQSQNETNSAKAVAKVARDSLAEVEARLVSSDLQREVEQKKLVETNNELAELSGRYKSILKELEQAKQEIESLRLLQQFYGEQASRAVNAGLSPEAEMITTAKNTKRTSKSKPRQH